jgi:hypothetical protein
VYASGAIHCGRSDVRHDNAGDQRLLDALIRRETRSIDWSCRFRFRSPFSRTMSVWWIFTAIMPVRQLPGGQLRPPIETFDEGILVAREDFINRNVPPWNGYRVFELRMRGVFG